MKLGDFGLAKFATNEPATHALCGTLAYSAPEVLMGEQFNVLIDEWSVGVIVYELLCGFLPFQAGKSFYETVVMVVLELDIKIKIGKIEYSFEASEWNNISPQAKDFISRLLCSNVSRISAEKALNDPWLINVEEI